MLIMAVQEKLYTADDLWELSHQVGDHKRLELVKGVLHEMAPTGDMHMVITAVVAYFLWQYVRPRKLGIVCGAEGGFVLSHDPYTVRAADAAFIRKSRIPKFTGKYFQFAPDLAVEVMSPNDKADEIRKKVIEYLKAGTLIVWVIYPDAKTVDICTPSTNEAFEAHVLDINGILDGGEVIPGFQLPVRDLFEDLELPAE
jgi:Uma2 family endonuclease